MKKYICNRYNICSNRVMCVRHEPHYYFYKRRFCDEYRIKVKDIEVPFVYYMEKKINEKAKRIEHAELPC